MGFLTTFIHLRKHVVVDVVVVVIAPVAVVGVVLAAALAVC